MFHGNCSGEGHVYTSFTLLSTTFNGTCGLFVITVVGDQTICDLMHGRRQFVVPSMISLNIAWGRRKKRWGRRGRKKGEEDGEEEEKDNEE